MHKPLMVFSLILRHILVTLVSVHLNNHIFTSDHTFLPLLGLKPQDFMLSIKENHFTSKNQLTITLSSEIKF